MLNIMQAVLIIQKNMGRYSGNCVFKEKNPTKTTELNIGGKIIDDDSGSNYF